MEYYLDLKYQNWNTAEEESDPPMSCINERAIRYAEVLLQLAECYLYSPTEQDLNKAVDYINQIRRRANLNDYSGAMNQTEIFKDLVSIRKLLNSSWRVSASTTCVDGDCWMSESRLAAM